MRSRLSWICWVNSVGQFFSIQIAHCGIGVGGAAELLQLDGGYGRGREQGQQENRGYFVSMKMHILRFAEKCFVR